MVLFGPLLLCLPLTTLASDSPTSSPSPPPAIPAAQMLRVPEGFEVVEYAGDALAHDIYSMTLDSQGRVVVAGAGYVKILMDQDGDGVADQAKLFADSPKSGAQGMFFHGRSLLAVGDAGLLRYRDQNVDDVADGPPDVLIRLKTGGEHDGEIGRQRRPIGLGGAVDVRQFRSGGLEAHRSMHRRDACERAVGCH
ncbi:MAG: hypothetical protein B7Z55_07850, partial [Planctomycetales bacterium 12-60-4]